MPKTLTDEEIRQTASDPGIETAVLKAVIDVEGGGSGFLPDGRPKILFEGHIFYSQLKKAGIDPDKMIRGNQDILFPRQTRAYYQGGAKEYGRLERASAINREEALKSASYGRFQLMGLRYREGGFDNVEAFVTAYNESEYGQLKAFCNFLRSQKPDRYLKEKDWGGFARHYNGAGYAANQYDKKLEMMYQKYSRSQTLIRPKAGPLFPGK